MSTPILLASAVSEPTVQAAEGQKHRSGPNFQFINLPKNAEDILVTVRGAFAIDSDGSEVAVDTTIGFNLNHDKGDWPDSTVNGSTYLMSGSTLSSSKVSAGANYYIADPQPPSGGGVLAYNFIVLFTLLS